jgi:raffinose/stachyose/melibiose transport system permease protein
VANWFALPAVLLILAFKGIPLALGVATSFTERSGSFGFANYERMFSDDEWIAALGNLVRAFVVVPILVVFPLVIAFILFQMRSAGRVAQRSAAVFRSICLLAYLIPPLMVGLIMRWVLADEGPLNLVLRAVGLGRLAIDWLGTSESALWAVLAVVVWSWYGLGVVIYLAGLSQLPQEQLDAAKVDGAGGRQLFTSIVIPYLVPTIAYWTVLCTAGLFIGLLPYVFTLTESGPGYATMMPEYYVWQVSTKFFEFQYGAALGVVLFLLLAAVTLVQIRLIYVRAIES